MKLNVGCGLDYREGFLNIDGNAGLKKVDVIMAIGKDSFVRRFGSDSVSVIVAQDVVEHLFRWEAVRLVAEFFGILRKGGKLEIRVPNAEAIMASAVLTVPMKIVLLFGGQDVPQGTGMDDLRKDRPELFCHKFGWTPLSLMKVLDSAGFSDVKVLRRPRDTNMTFTAIK